MSSSLMRCLCLLALLAAVVAFLIVFLNRSDPVLDSARELETRLTSDEALQLPRAERRQLELEQQQLVQQLTPAQRRFLGEQRRRLLLDRIEAFQQLPRAEQRAFLDRELDRLLLYASDEESAPDAGLVPASGPGAALPKGKPTVTPPARLRKPQRSPDEHERQLKIQLDATTPAQRAAVGDLVQQLYDLAQARGLNLSKRTIKDLVDLYYGSPWGLRLRG